MSKLKTETKPKRSIGYKYLSGVMITDRDTLSKTFETKKKILDILRQGAKTPGDISKLLGLSPSTVSQHLKELKENGRIEELQDEHFKNIKYYKRLENPSIFASNTSKVAIGAFAIILLAALVISFVGRAPTVNISSNQTNSVGIFMTDPPQVPSDTQSLIVSYSSLKVQITNSSGTFWDSINGSGSVDLLSLVNFTKNLTAFKLPINSTVDRLSLGIANATITVNGTAYPVVITDPNVSVKVFYGSKNGTAFDILFDMFPTVSEVITGNQTTFVMAPSATATTIGKSSNPYYQNNSGIRPQGPGQGPGFTRINGQEKLALNQSRSKITITGASINTSGNQTTISVEVADDSNQSTQLIEVAIFGNESYDLDLNLTGNNLAQNSNAPYIAINTNSRADRWQGRPADANYAQYGNPNGGQMFNGSYGSGTVNYSGGLMPQPPNMTVPQVHDNDNHGGMWPGGASVSPNFIKIRLNDSSIASLMENLSNGTVKANINGMLRGRGFGNISANPMGNAIFNHIVGDISSADYIKSDMDRFRAIDFFVASNGTLTVPQPGMFMPEPMIHGVGPAAMENALPGYNLSSGETATLKYSGSLSLGNGSFGLQFKPGQTYRIMVTGTGCAFAIINVTAS